MKNTAAQKILMAVYLLIAAVMYLFNNAYFTLGVDFMYKFVMAVLIIAISFVVFLITANLARAKILIKYILVLALPNMAILFVSLPLWAINATPLETIRGGIFSELYQINMIVAMAGILYVFGSKGIWLNLAGMLAANLVSIGLLIADAGLGAYLQEMKELIVTFAGTVGPLAAASELHEITFALGAVIPFVIFTFFEQKNKGLTCLFLAVTVFCYLSGLKRMGLAALGLAFLIGFGLEALMRNKNSRRGWLLFAAVVAMALVYVYLVFVRNGLFDYLSEHFNVDTMGRRNLNDLAERYYRVTPDFLGWGGGFVSSLFRGLPEGSILALHNDILQVYIETGFWGFWLWMLCYIFIRVYFVAKWQGAKGGILCLVYAAYVLATASTDNTIFYVYVTGAVAISIMGYRLEELEGDVP